MARIAVVGAGIIGAATAAWLISNRHDVSVFERDERGKPASTGNAGLIALPEIGPLASPRILASVPRWLLDPLGPLAMRWRDLPALTPWLLAFLLSALPPRVTRGRANLAFLMRTALADHQELGTRTGIQGHLRQTGFLAVCEQPATLKEAAQEAERVRALLSYDFDVLEPATARARVPQLEGAFAGAVHSPAYWMVGDPAHLLNSLRGFLTERGGLIGRGVQNLTSALDHIIVHDDTGENHIVDAVIVAAGIWSRAFVRALGLKVRLEAERGYNTTFTALDWRLSMPIGFAEHGFVASPLSTGLRVGGAVELAAPGAPPNFARARAMREKMRKFVPALPCEGGTEWMGPRPSTPDSLPVISRHPNDRRILFAFGHGHLGLTLSAVTARHVARLIDATDDADLKPFDISRFQ